MALPDPALPIGRRIEWYRKRAGMSRPMLAAQVDRSAGWLKHVESGRLLPPRIDMLLRIAQALDVKDLADLVAGDVLPVELFAGARHDALASVQAALTDYQITPITRTPNVAHISVRLDRAWRIRHASPDHRTQLGALLPGLIRDAQLAARTASAEGRRDARRLLSGVYQLADFYVATSFTAVSTVVDTAMNVLWRGNPSARSRSSGRSLPGRAYRLLAGQS